ncbi:hypothetical protein ACJX0J_018194 [Zea mays]
MHLGRSRHCHLFFFPYYNCIINFFHNYFWDQFKELQAAVRSRDLGMHSTIILLGLEHLVNQKLKNDISLILYMKEELIFITRDTSIIWTDDALGKKRAAHPLVVLRTSGYRLNFILMIGIIGPIYGVLHLPRMGTTLYFLPFK